MPDLAFTWDPNKAASNLRKHQVSFGEAQTVFLDENALVIADPDHSLVEERFVIMGLSRAARVLVVVHCLRQDRTVIRIISARRADTKEQQPYWEKIK
jgi:uncharacterized DUF497 family protein